MKIDNMIKKEKKNAIYVKIYQHNNKELYAKCNFKLWENKFKLSGWILLDSKCLFPTNIIKRNKIEEIYFYL